jgi:DNA-binding NtrC family response regulator
MRRIVFWLAPCYARQTMSDQKRQPTAETAACHGCSALVADDNEGIRRSVAAQLKRHGIASTLAGNGRQASALLAKHDFDLVITDLDMPEMNGLDLLLWLRERDPGMPVVVMSGTLPPDVASVAFLRNNALAVLLKPFGSQELAAALRPVCERLHAARLGAHAA